MIYPDFFIGGSQKCGTTSLAAWLDTHPSLECASPKEPNFFSNRGLAELEQDFSIFFQQDNAEKDLLRFEATTSYMTDRVALENIERTLGHNKKFIFILKDPAKRAISAYYHLFKHYAEKRDIEDVLANIPKDPEEIFAHENDGIKLALKNGRIDITRYRKKYDNFTWAYHYLYNSLYSKHIQKFSTVFGKSNVLCLSLESLKTNPHEHFKKITDFLEVDPFEELPDINTTHNRTKIPSYMYSSHIRENKFLLKGAIHAHNLCRQICRKDIWIEEPRPLSQNKMDNLKTLFVQEYEFLDSL